MEIRLTVHEAVRMFGIWQRELSASQNSRVVEGGSIQLDAVPSCRGAVHQMNGSLVVVWYRAANAPTARAIREASVATQMMNLPRQLYMGKLIDIKKGADDTVYFLVRSMTRQDSANDNAPAYRAFNPSKGELIEMIINPSAATIAASGGQMAPACIQQPSSAPAVAPTVVPQGVAVRRSNP